VNCGNPPICLSVTAFTAATATQSGARPARPSASSSSDLCPSVWLVVPPEAKPLLFLVAAAAIYSRRQLATADRPRHQLPLKTMATSERGDLLLLELHPSFSLVPNSNGSGTLFPFSYYYYYY